MGTSSFQIRNETLFCKAKASGNPRRRRGTQRSKVSAKKSRDCAETYILYVAQGIPLIDTEIAKKGPFLDGNWLGTLFFSNHPDIRNTGVRVLTPFILFQVFHHIPHRIQRGGNPHKGLHLNPCPGLCLDHASGFHTI